MKMLFLFLLLGGDYVIVYMWCWACLFIGVPTKPAYRHDGRANLLFITSSSSVIYVSLEVLIVSVVAWSLTGRSSQDCWRFKHSSKTQYILWQTMLVQTLKTQWIIHSWHLPASVSLHASTSADLVEYQSTFPLLHKVLHLGHKELIILINASGGLMFGSLNFILIEVGVQKCLLMPLKQIAKASK